MLHPRSPLDDPTRAFRAVRYANRLGFAIEPETRGWIRNAVEENAVHAVSGDRLRRELALIFSEPNRGRAVRDLARLGLAAAVHPSLGADAAAIRRLSAAERLAAKVGLEPTWLVYLLAWMGESSETAAREIAARLNLPARAAAAVRGWPQTWGKLAEAARDAASLRLAAVEKLSDDEALAAAATLPAASGRNLLDARRAATDLRLRIRGRDLLAAGVPPGPAIGRALSATLVARRDGAISPDEELSFALKSVRP
jgi:tRNA nucleotidyltransferase (CCA-adding enzyme)